LVEDVLLPLMDWQEHLSRTRRSGRKADIAMALKAAQDAFE
jgi:hypothetical protein